MDNKINYIYQFTVFTATYNRGYILRRAFESLQKQTFMDFEWVVVDDGSTDNTEELVCELAKEALFPVRYFYQTHGHKKKAINRGVQEAQGELFIFLDSDDELTPNALDRFNYHWQNIPVEDKQRFCGIFGLTQYADGSVMGSAFPYLIMESNLNDMLFRYKSVGERSVAFVTTILKEYPFPEAVTGLVPEGMIWARIARQYQALFVNEISRIYYVSEDSITPKERFGAFAQERAEGRALHASEFLNNEMEKYFFYDPKQFCVEAIMYIRSSLHIEKNKIPQIFYFWGRCLIYALYPIGFICACLDKLKVNMKVTKKYVG